MRVLLIQPDQKRSLGLYQIARIEPLGLEMVAGALRERHEVDIVDLRMAPKTLEASLADFKPDLVGISSSFTVDIYETLRVAETVRAANPRAFVFVGGHHPSLYPSDFKHPAVDAIVVGEGEITTRELVDCLAEDMDVTNVPGLVLNWPDEQQATGPRGLISDLDDLAHPERSLTRSYGQAYRVGLSGPVAAVETARGCPFNCNFCSVWRFYQGQIRFKTAERVVQELEDVEEPAVLFTDDNFLVTVPRALEIARLIEERGIRKHYIMQARSDAIARHPEVIERWVNIGLTDVFIGFETANQAELDSVNKHNSAENNERALAVLRDHGLEPIVSFIVHPDYTHQDFDSLKAYVRQLELAQAMYSILTPLPGTDLFEELRDQLIMTNYELWDLMHAVLPTRLPIREFYAEFADLFRLTYPCWKVMLGGLYLAWRRLRQGREAGEVQILRQVIRLQKPSSYLET
jgi:radical SAM superfamily enzyme YgiQ (UPF0313 family)